MKPGYISFHSRLALAAVVAAGLSCQAMADSRLEITGVEGDLAENIRLLVGDPPPVEQSRKFRSYLNALADQAGIAMGALGYYAAEFDISQRVEPGAQTTTPAEDSNGASQPNVEIDDPQDTAIVTIAVTPNDPVRIESVDIRINGDAGDDPAYVSVLADLPLSKGEVFISGEYEASKSALIDQAQDLGYFEFQLTTTEVRVSRRRLTADITLVAESGPRYTFGDINFEQDVFSRSFLDRWVPYEKGDPYEAGLIGELTQNLQNSGYFKSVRVIPLQDRRYGTVVPVTVKMERMDSNQVAIGVGYASDTRIRTKLTWGKPLINRRGHSAEYELGLSRDKQNLSFSYRIPRDKEPLYNFWSMEYGLQNERQDDLKSLVNTLNFQRVSRTSRQWIESLFVRWERETFTTEGVDDTTNLVMPGFSYQRSRGKGSPFPVWGQSASLQVMGGSKAALSTIDFFKTVASFRYLRALSNRNTLIASVQYGGIRSNDYDRVPLSQRFFAGGDNSVRGFAYKDISPVNEAGEAVGGRYLEVLSLEYNYRFRDRWSLALFTDAGRAFNSIDEPYSVGAGAGIRWQSPVGPFRLDIARPVSDNADGGYRVHLSLGPDF